MSAVNPELAREIARRRTFAIISHPHECLAVDRCQPATK
jgi:hypothetical protein